MRQQRLIEWALVLTSAALLMLTVIVLQGKRQQLTRQDVHEIVDSVLIEVYD